MLFILVRITILLLVGSANITVIINAELACGKGEILDECPVDCPYDYCPEYEHQDKIPCPKPTECPPAKCKCVFNFRKTNNGTCIPTTDCSPFECTRPNEVYQPCPSYCPSDDCSDASALGGCPYWLLIVVYCSPQCKCTDGYWRKDGVCVPYDECPNVVAQKSDEAKTTAMLGGIALRRNDRNVQDLVY